MVNVTDHPNYPSARKKILNDSALMAKLREILAEDIDLYEQVVRTSDR